MSAADGFFECFNLPIVLEICFLSCSYMFLIEMSQGCVFDRPKNRRFLLKHDGWETRPSSRCYDQFRTYRSLG